MGLYIHMCQLRAVHAAKWSSDACADLGAWLGAGRVDSAVRISIR